MAACRRRYRPASRRGGGRGGAGDVNAAEDFGVSDFDQGGAGGGGEDGVGHILRWPHYYNIIYSYILHNRH